VVFLGKAEGQQSKITYQFVLALSSPRKNDLRRTGWEEVQIKVTNVRTHVFNVPPNPNDPSSMVPNFDTLHLTKSALEFKSSVLDTEIFTMLEQGRKTI